MLFTKLSHTVLVAESVPTNLIDFIISDAFPFLIIYLLSSHGC